MKPTGCGRRARGFTLIEALIAVAIIGIAGAIAFETFNATHQRYRLEGTARELTAFLSSVPGVAKEQHAPVFVIWNPPGQEVLITSDAAGVNELERFPLPGFLVVTPANLQTYRCDTIGRAFAGTGAAMLNAPQVLTVTHRAMASGSLTPNTQFRLTLSPLWHVRTDKRLI